MVNAQNYAQGWNWLKRQVDSIDDMILRNTLMAEFRQRAISEWGFDPTNGRLATGEEVELNDWEKEFLQDIRDTAKYGFNTRAEKQKQTHKVALANMRIFIDQGGTLADIPEHIRTKPIQDLYHEALYRNIDETMELADEIDRRDTARPVSRDSE